MVEENERNNVDSKVAAEEAAKEIVRQKREVLKVFISKLKGKIATIYIQVELQGSQGYE